MTMPRAEAGTTSGAVLMMAFLIIRGGSGDAPRGRHPSCRERCLMKILRNNDLRHVPMGARVLMTQLTALLPCPVDTRAPRGSVRRSGGRLRIDAGAGRP